MVEPVQNQTPAVVTPTRSKGPMVLIVILIVLLLAALGLNVWFMMRLTAMQQAGTQATAQPTAAASAMPLTEEVPAGVDGSYTSVPGPQAYQNQTHGFSLTYPEGVHAVGTAGENGIPVLFLDTKPIQVPVAWDFQLTPVEFRVIPATDEVATLDEAAAKTRAVLKPSTVQLTRVTQPYGGIKLSGTMEVDGSELGSHIFYFFQLHNGVLEISYVRDNTNGFPEAQLNEIINSLTITGPEV